MEETAANSNNSSLSNVTKNRKLSIAYGKSRMSKKWVNKTVSYEELKELLKTPIRTVESVEEYAKMKKSDRDAAKDHGGFVAGVLKGGSRTSDNVECRSMITQKLYNMYSI